MDRIIICLNKVVHYNESYTDDMFYVLQHKPFKNHLLIFKDTKYKKTYYNLEQKLTKFLLNDSIAFMYLRYGGDRIITDDIEVVEIKKYHISNGDGLNMEKFLKRLVPYALAITKKDMVRLLNTYFKDTEYGWSIYDCLTEVKWEDGMYLEIYKE